MPLFEQITIPAVRAGQNMLLTIEVIENDTPLLLSKDAMKKANTYIDFANDEIIILNKEIPVNLITAGHYCIPIGKIVDNNHEEILKSESILFVMM